MPFRHDNFARFSFAYLEHQQQVFPAFVHVRMNQLPKIMKHSFRLRSTLAISPGEQGKQGETGNRVRIHVEAPSPPD